MPIEIVIASFGALFLAVLGLYASSHREEDKDKSEKGHHPDLKLGQ